MNVVGDLERVVQALSFTSVSVKKQNILPEEDPFSGLLLARNVNKLFAVDGHLRVRIKELAEAYLIPFLVHQGVWYYTKELVEKGLHGNVTSRYSFNFGSNKNRALPLSP